MSRDLVASIEREYARYREMAEKAMAQLSEEELGRGPAPGDNSVAVIAGHISGNLKSRFTNFLTTDGEKPWRDRDAEFDARAVTPEELQRKWDDGWAALAGALSALTDDDLGRGVTIRAEPHSVAQALHRSLAHTASHVGQIVYVAKSLRGESWRTLSIPRRK